jgi:CRP-like cAMP-binding protein
MSIETDSFKLYLTQMIHMDEASFEHALPYFKVEKIGKGEYLIREGQICNKIAFIHEGLFRIYHLKDGYEINTCFCFESSITSSFNSFINHSPSFESIQALENSIVVTLTSDNLNELYNKSAIWQTVSRLLTEKECLRLSERASSLSFETALEKYKYLLRFQPQIIRRVSVQHIASYLGVSRETMSRIRSQIQD